MIEEFRKFAGNKILGWLLMHPSTPVSINELARNLSVSPATVLKYVNLFEEALLVSRRTAGTAHHIIVNNESPLVCQLKKCAMLLLLHDAGIREIAPGAVSIALYGSMASGRFDEKSDIDLLVLGEEKDVDRDRVLAIQEKLGIPVQLTVLPWHSFETLKEKNDPFVRTVLENHVLISGSGL
jgi:predicted nucleotidyltransferase